MPHSLAKWKRVIINEYDFSEGEGILVIGQYVRPTEKTLDDTHSMYLPQIDWELRIKDSDRTLDFLKSTVRKIFGALKKAE